MAEMFFARPQCRCVFAIDNEYEAVQTMAQVCVLMHIESANILVVDFGHI